MTRTPVFRRTAAVLLCALCVLCLLPGPCASASVAAPAQENLRLQQANAYLAEELEKARVPFAMAVFVGPQGVLSQQGFGDIPDTPQDKAFVLGSLSKSFTALAVMQLAEAGKLDLDAPMAAQLEGWPATGSTAGTITPRDLLHHRSGLSAYEKADNLRFKSRYGTFAYSNTGYNLLGRLVEQAAGQPFDAYVNDAIFKPLGMQHSTADLDAARQAGTLAEGHRSWFGAPATQRMATPKPDAYIGPASGTLAASAADMALYLQMLLNHGAAGDTRLLSAQGIDTLMQGAVSTGNDPIAKDFFAGAQGSYGMGWVEKEVDGTRLVFHTGKIPGYNSLMALLPEQEVGVVLLCNLGDFLVASPMVETAGEGALRILMNQEPVAQWEYNHLLQHIVIDLICLLVLLTALTPLLMWGFWRRRLIKKPISAPFIARLVLLHLVYPAALALVPLVLGIPPGVLADFAPDVMLTLVASILLLLTVGVVKIALLGTTRKRWPRPATPPYARRPRRYRYYR